MVEISMQIIYLLLQFSLSFFSLLCATGFSLQCPIRPIQRHIQMPTANCHIWRSPQLIPICGRPSTNVNGEKTVLCLAMPLSKRASGEREAEETVSRRLSYTWMITIPVILLATQMVQQDKKKKKPLERPNHSQCLLFLRLNNWSDVD